MESPGGRRGRRSQDKESRWLWLAMLWEVPPGWALVDPVFGFHALGSGKNHGAVGCRKHLLELSLA